MMEPIRDIASEAKHGPAAESAAPAALPAGWDRAEIIFPSPLSHIVVLLVSAVPQSTASLFHCRMLSHVCFSVSRHDWCESL